MDVETLTDAAAFRTLQAEWLALLSHMPSQSVFLTPQWQETWWHHFARDHQLSLLTVRSDDGVLRGLAPLMRSTGMESPSRLEFIGDVELCDYFDILVDPAYEQAVGAILGSALVAQTSEDVELCLTNLSSHSHTTTWLRQSLEDHGLTVVVEEIETCPTIVLPDDWETYLNMLRSKDRHEMRRKIRRAETTAHLEYVMASDATMLSEALETFFSLHRMSQQPDKRQFMTVDKVAFFRDLAHQLWTSGWLELATLQADGVAIAALCCFPYNGTYAAYNACYHPDYRHLSAGIVLFANRIQSAIARRFIRFDFLRGNEPYKYRFGANDQPLLQLFARTACPVSGSCL